MKILPATSEDNMQVAKYTEVPAPAPNSIIAIETGNEAKKYSVSLPVGIIVLIHKKITAIPVKIPVKAIFLLKFPPTYLTAVDKIPAHAFAAAVCTYHTLADGA